MKPWVTRREKRHAKRRRASEGRFGEEWIHNRLARKRTARWLNEWIARGAPMARWRNRVFPYEPEPKPDAEHMP